MAQFPALPLWTDAIIGDTFHLSPAEFGAYMRLLIVSWRRPNCDLPDDDAFLGRCVGDTRNWHRMKAQVMGFFTLGDDGLYRQKRLLREREYVSRRSVIQSENASARWNKNKGLPDAAAMPSQSHGNAPIPNPYPQEVSKKVVSFNDFGGKKNGNGSHTTIEDPTKRLLIYHNWLASLFPDKKEAWEMIRVASDPTEPNHLQALSVLKELARANGKGWPRQWLSQ